jgi:hypothetical protein
MQASENHCCDRPWCHIGQVSDESQIGRRSAGRSGSSGRHLIPRHSDAKALQFRQHEPDPVAAFAFGLQFSKGALIGGVSELGRESAVG